MVQVQSIDTSGLKFMISGLQSALFATGGDIDQTLSREGKLLSLEVAKRVGPNDKRRRAKSIVMEVGRVFAPTPKVKMKQKAGPITWLDYGEHYLDGIDSRNYLPGLVDVKTMEYLYLKTPNQSLGHKRTLVGMHGKQKVGMVNRLMVSRSAFKNFANYVISHVGRMKASWVANAIKIAQIKLQGEQYSAPEWIARHINGNTTPKSICNLEGLNGKDYQTLTIGSSSIGNSRQVENVQRAVKARERKVSERLKLVLSGYSKDVAKGIRIKRHSHDS